MIVGVIRRTGVTGVQSGAWIAAHASLDSDLSVRKERNGGIGDEARCEAKGSAKTGA